MTYTFDQFCEEIPERAKPFLDWDECYLDGIQGDENDPFVKLSNTQKFWRKNGYVIQKGFMPNDLIDAYCAKYEADNGEGARKGYGIGTPYMNVKEIKDLCLYDPLTELLGALVGERMGMNLNLTNWVSTERNWHQDDYLNPEHVNGHYLAAWIALDDIHPDSCPFEFVPGSHKWPVMRQRLVKAHLSDKERDTPDWPWHAEQFLNDVFEREIENRGAKPMSWDTAKKGDVLIWHPWLAHRGSKPKNPDLLRKSMICHYSGIHHRPDMAAPVLYENGVSRGHYFPF